MVDRSALEQQIYESPDDPAGYLVLGDWLASRGDPRGTLIAVQAARLAGDSDELRAAEAALVAELGELVPDGHQLATEWYLGFWRSLVIGSVEVEPILAIESARFLRELRIRLAPTQDVLDELGAVQRTLRGLHVWCHEPIDDRGLRAIRPLRELRRLTLSPCTSVTPYGLEVLRDLRHVEDLELFDCTITDDAAEHLAGLPLATVRFHGVVRLTARGMRPIASLPLHSLELSGEHIDDSALEPLGAHPTLDHLSLADTPLGVRGASALGTIAGLRRLNLCSSTLGDEAVGRLQPSLRVLHLGHCESITDVACAHIARMRELQFLDLSSTQVTAAGLRLLAGLPDLEHLDLGFLDLRDADVAELAAFGRLRSLSLAFSSDLSDAVIDTIEKLEHLATLDLAAAEISTEAIDRLASMPRLSHLGVYDCPWTTIVHAETYKHWYLSQRDTVDLHDD